MYGLGRRCLPTTDSAPAAPHSGLPAAVGREAFTVSPLRAGGPRARVPGPANPRPAAVTASAG